MNHYLSLTLSLTPSLSFSVPLPLPPSISLPCAVAEVQAHSSQHGQAQMDQLREQLLEAFRQQMEMRKGLMELENSHMQIQIDTSKHLLTIAESVLFTLPFPCTCVTHTCVTCVYLNEDSRLTTDPLKTVRGLSFYDIKPAATFI